MHACILYTFFSKPRTYVHTVWLTVNSRLHGTRYQPSAVRAHKHHRNVRAFIFRRHHSSTCAQRKRWFHTHVHVAERYVLTHSIYVVVRVYHAFRLLPAESRGIVCFPRLSTVMATTIAHISFTQFSFTTISPPMLVNCFHAQIRTGHRYQPTPQISRCVSDSCFIDEMSHTIARQSINTANLQ